MCSSETPLRVEVEELENNFFTNLGSIFTSYLYWSLRLRPQKYVTVLILANERNYYWWETNQIWIFIFTFEGALCFHIVPCKLKKTLWNGILDWMFFSLPTFSLSWFNVNSSSFNAFLHFFVHCVLALRDFPFRGINFTPTAVWTG